MNQAALDKEGALLEVLFGSDVNSAVILKAQDNDASKCPQTIARDLKKCQDTKLKEFEKCKKSALVSGAMTNAELEACVLADAKGKIAKACDDPIKPDEIRKDLESA